MLEGKQILVTGGAGFIGSHLVDALAPRNEVTVLDNLSEGTREQIHEAADFVAIDVRDRDALEGVLGSPDVIFHLAADAHTKATAAGWDDPYHDLENNAVGTQHLFETVRASDTDPTVVYASSCAIYGNPQYAPMDEAHPKNPISPYGVHKLAGDRYVYAYHSEYGLKTRSIRIFNTYGPRQPRYVMYDFLKKLQRDGTRLEVLGTGEQVRDYTYIDDAVDAFELVAEHGTDGEAYNMSGEQITSIGELATTIIDLLGLESTVEYTGSSWKGDPVRLEADIEKLRELGYEPSYSLETGLEQLIEWFERAEGAIAAGPDRSVPS